jgi:hypothetical protein
MSRILPWIMLAALAVAPVGGELLPSARASCVVDGVAKEASKLRHPSRIPVPIREGVVRGDRAAWSEYLLFLSRGDQSFQSADELMDAFFAAPEAMRRDILKEAVRFRMLVQRGGASEKGSAKRKRRGTSLPTWSGNSRPSGNLAVEGKRLLDRFFYQGLRADVSFREAIARGATPMEAFGEHLKRMEYFSGTSLKADDVLAVARAVQGQLRKRNFPGESVALGGSFVNGTATKSSDLDAFGPRFHPLAVSSARYGPQEEMDLSMRKAIQRETGRDLNFRYTQGYSGSYPSRLNPFYIQVTKDKIVLHVGGPGALTDGQWLGDTILLPTDPQAFEIE